MRKQIQWPWMERFVLEGPRNETMMIVLFWPWVFCNFALIAADMAYMAWQICDELAERSIHGEAEML